MHITIIQSMYCAYVFISLAFLVNHKLSICCPPAQSWGHLGGKMPSVPATVERCRTSLVCLLW